MIPQAIQPGTWLPGNPPCIFLRVLEGRRVYRKFRGAVAGGQGRGRESPGDRATGAAGTSVTLGKPVNLYTSVSSSVQWGS